LISPTKLDDITEFGERQLTENAGGAAIDDKRGAENARTELPLAE
jgi:hypothetical protein